MRISIFAQVEGDDTGSGRTVPIGAIERDSLADPASGMGLWVQESHELLEHIQTVVLDEQGNQFIRAVAHCLACTKPLGVKDTKSVVYRTAFGKMSIPSPRFYSCCTQCGYATLSADCKEALDRFSKEQIPLPKGIPDYIDSWRQKVKPGELAARMSLEEMFGQPG